MIDALPWRAAGAAAAHRPVDLAHMPVMLGGRARKRWRYAGVFGERLMLCAGAVQIGRSRQVFWAVWDREREALRERTRLLRGRDAVRLRDDAVAIADGPVVAALRAEPGGPVPVETASPHDGGWIWTRKRAGVRFTGTVVLAGEEIAVDARGCVDESAGYHARDTAWEWSAGVGEAVDGRAVGWNLVTGLHDAERDSERTIWVDGEPAEAPPVTFGAALDHVAFPGGERLAFTTEATRTRRDDLVVVRSDYVQPFGAFAGTLPGGIALAAGRGVMERHAARW